MRPRPVPFSRRWLLALGPAADYWLAETLSSQVEAELVREVLGADAKPLWLSFTLADGQEAEPADPRLRSGEPVGEAVAAAARLGAAAILFNCSRPEVMGGAVSEAVRVRAAVGRECRTMRMASTPTPSCRSNR